MTLLIVRTLAYDTADSEDTGLWVINYTGVSSRCWGL